MNKKFLAALIIFVLSIALHGYLTSHYYPLKFGVSSGESLCNISQTFDCDSVSASPYSTFMSVPMSVWGISANSAIVLLMILSWFGLGDRLLRWAFLLAGLSVVASVVMASISLLAMSTYCLFCITLYVLSFIGFELFRRSFDSPVMPELIKDLRMLASDYRSLFFVVLMIPALVFLWSQSTIYGTLATAVFVGVAITTSLEFKDLALALMFIPVTAFLSHASFVQGYNGAELQQSVRSSIFDWQASPVIEFSAPPLAVHGPEKNQARMTIVEFADFRCIHCKNAVTSLKAFKRAHQDVRFEFYSFPLDGECNSEIESGNGVSCRLAKAMYCAKDQAWEMHDLIFDHFETFVRAPQVSSVDQELKQFTHKLNIDWSGLEECMESPEAQDVIHQQVQDAVRARVRGTPSFYVNGRKLDRGQQLPVLQGLREHILKSQ